MSPSESLDSIDHDQHDARRRREYGGGGEGGEDEDTPMVSRAAPPGRGQRQGLMVNPHGTPTPRAAEGRYSDRPVPVDPFADTPAIVATAADQEEGGQGHVYPQPGQSGSGLGGGAYDPVGANAYTVPGEYPGPTYDINGNPQGQTAYGYNPYANDPNINLLAWNNPGMNPYLTQDLVAMPYRPMQPRFKKWAKSEIKPEDCVLPLLLITFQTG